MVKLFSDIQIGDTIYKVTKTKKVVPAKVFALGKSLFGENTTFYYEGSKVPFTANPCLPFAKERGVTSHSPRRRTLPTRLSSISCNQGRRSTSLRLKCYPRRTKGSPRSSTRLSGHTRMQLLALSTHIAMQAI